MGMNIASLRHSVAVRFCRHRRSWIGRLMGQTAYLVWRAYENRNFDMPTNGEEWLLERVSSLKNINCIFDVGANVGDWTIACSKHFPRVPIHAFEIAPPVFSVLKKNVAHLKNPVLNSIGLSDQNGQIEIYYTDDSNYLTTAYQENLADAYRLPGAGPAAAIKSLAVPVMRGDDYVGQAGIKTIDILKIDVEGMEERVLLGFQPLFAGRRIRLVQFEYNTTNIVSKFMLRDACDFFGRLGYRVGKLYPNYVEFRDYHYRQEDFGGPNIIAVHKDDHELLQLLNPRR